MSHLLHVYETDSEKRNEFLLLQEILHRIEKGNWEELKGPLITHPVVRVAVTREGQTLLHLAVIANRKEIVQELSRDPHLKHRPNRFGLTPVELAQLLNRKEIIPLLKSGSTSSIQFPDPKLEYLSHPIFEKEGILGEILIKTQKAKLEDQIPPEKIWMGVYFDKEIQNGLHPPVEIRHIDEEVGFGVFSKGKIPPCAYVGEYTGIIQERKRKHLKDKVYCVRYTVWEMGRRNFVIDAEQKGNFTRFINHSAKPNLGLQSVYWRGLPRMIFVALKEIQEGTQLTFDYGSFFWKECCQTPKIIE